MCSFSSVALHVSVLCLCASPRSGAQDALRPFLAQVAPHGPSLRAACWRPCPQILRSLARAGVGGWSLRPLESCLGKPELWLGVELSPRLVYVAEVQGGACAHLLWARGCQAWGAPGGLVSSGQRAGGALASWAWAWRHGTTASAQSVPGSLLRPSPRPCALPSASWAMSGASAAGGSWICHQPWGWPLQCGP